MGRVFRGYPVRFFALWALAGALLALPAAAAATPVPTIVSKSVTLGPSGVTPASLSCPGKSVALSGYASSLPSGALARDSISAGARGWTFRFMGAGGRAVVGLRCLRVKPPRGPSHTNVKVLSGRKEFLVAPGAARSVRANCPRGYVPTGYGMDRSQAGAAPAQLVLESAAPAARSWSFRVRNRSNATRVVSIQLRCIVARATGVQAGHPVAERFSIRRLGFSDAPGGSPVSHSCGVGSFAMAVGYTLPDGSAARATDAFPAGTREGRWSFSGAGAATLRTYLTCLSLRTRFR